MAPRIRAVWLGASIAAPAYPIRCTPADNLAIHLGVTLAPPGSVLVVDASHEPERGYWGEVLTTAAEARGLAGLVIDGCVRDVAALESHGFAVFSAGIALRGAAKTSGGAVGVPVTVGNVEVDPGDWIVGDRDGVAVVPAAQLAEVIAAGEERAAKEAGLMVQLRGGASTVELLGLDTSPVQQP
jgi:4-hydroxy-4-methyl-2-oxoglutarate aldolase